MAQTQDSAPQDGSKKVTLTKASKTIFMVLVAVFLGRFFYRNFGSIQKLNLMPTWPLLGVSLVFYCMYKLTQTYFWHYITVLNDASIALPDAFRAYLYSILGKYIPGKVFTLLARIPPYQERGVSAQKVTVCYLLENVCTILGAGLLFIVSLSVFPNETFRQYKWITILLIVVFIICLNPAILNFMLGLVEKVTKKRMSRIQITYPQMIKIVFLFLLNWIIHGTGFYFLVCSFCPVPLSQWLYVSGIYALSCIIGILAFFSPSGLGVREGILLLGLGLIMDQNYAMMLSLIARLWAELAELAPIAVLSLHDLIFRRGKKAEPSA